MEKETGEGEFIVPEILKRAWQKRDFGRNISVHMRYILFICETFGATSVLAELGF